MLGANVRVFRGILLLFMVWLLGIFLPGHQRGAITLNGDSQGPATKASSCCAREHTASAKKSGKPTSGKPSPQDVASCAVCHWAAGLLYTPPFVLDFSHAERAFERARQYHAQVQSIALRLNHHGRDPPAASIV